MWQDWQGTSVTDAKANIAALRSAIITGAPVSISVSGVRVEYSTQGKTTNDPRRLIQELQDYVYKIEIEGWDNTLPIAPHDRRPATTSPEFL